MVQAPAAVPEPDTYDVVYQTSSGGTVYATLESEGPLFSLYNSLRLFYANGGGPCYIVSVGSYEDKLSQEALLRGLEVALTRARDTATAKWVLRSAGRPRAGAGHSQKLRGTFDPRACGGEAYAKSQKNRLTQSQLENLEDALRRARDRASGTR